MDPDEQRERLCDNQLPKLALIEPHNFILKPECTGLKDCKCRGKGCIVRATKPPEPESGQTGAINGPIKPEQREE